MARRIPHCEPSDLQLPTPVLAAKYGVSNVTAYRWKKRAGLDTPRGKPKGVRGNALVRLITPEEWKLGCSHVARLLGTSQQNVWGYRQRLLAEGADIPGPRKRAAVSAGRG